MGNAESYENYKKEVIFIKSNRFKILGRLITITSFIFIVKMLLSVNIEFNVIRNAKDNLLLLIILVFWCSVGLYLVAYGWSMLIKFIEPREIVNFNLASIYVKANIAKYLPGNVMNLIGRNVLAGKLGFKQISIATSTIMEIIIFGSTTMVLAFLFSITKLNYMVSIIKQYINYKVSIVVMIFLILFFTILLLYILKNKKKYVNKIKKYCTMEFLKLTIRLVFLYGIYFIYLGIMLVIILRNVLCVSTNLNNMLQVIGFFVLSYFIGYIVPGSPGGMGVREAVLILLLTSIVGENLAIAAALMHRIITITADLVLYCINYLIEKFEILPKVV
ncbi:lysylphosphatidylglycerol synthase domain-containing protein [Clostridium saccharoperbutylacetonicum]|uniref:lysylphosphatidylglycerol synthase domain-containing protein n=1 Tax=Clostridium saccharoperbutylacetonicum TaxID=36745 RepID=UPI000983BB35|nr:lysylphosphatidylglycerol synthase domain-containing protein [Clostridium saccharoperbutylacetonicum]AQR97822.1 hypothetical protein CLSAP_51550 [Clostridium saccharoperbutylacetonicum]NSB33712.1 hypothetical protein [Clostridium saccharoperbutylacetonicum]